MDPVYYKILHVFSLLVLTAWTFAAFANPAPETRRQTLIVAGIASLLMLVGNILSDIIYAIVDPRIRFR